MKKNNTYLLTILATAAMAMLLVWGCKKDETIKLASLSTLTVTEITKNTAKCGGDITNDGGGEITSRGVVWSLSQNPTIAQNLGYTLNIPGTGQFDSNISDLTRYTKYYVRAYATNRAGVAYGNELEFTTEGEPSVITTEPITSITAITAVCGGNITDDGGATITLRGVVWSNSPNPTIAENLGSTSNGNGIGSFSSELTSLTPNTTYYIRSFATNSLGTYYGLERNFSTRNGIFSITSTAVTNITLNSAQTGGNISTDEGAPITVRGVVWSTSQSPTVETNQGITSNGTGIGTFTSNLTNLQLGTVYYVRAYATNSVGTIYGNQQTFTTRDGIISLTTTAATSVTATSATSGGNISTDGGAAVTVRGVVWSTSQSPTVETNLGITSNGTGIGTFTSYLTNLQVGTVYYVRAYATNSVGTTYGNQQTFTTRDGLISLTTTAASIITATTATCGGNISSDGGVSVTARGVVWSTSQTPTTSNNQGITSNGTGTGSFSSNLTGLTANTTYYVRAYATNSISTTYGNQIIILTLDNNLLYESFNYTAGEFIGGNTDIPSSSNNWVTHAVTVGTIVLTAESLNYTGLAASAGNKVFIPGNNTTCTRDVNRAVDGGVTKVIYYSVLVKIIDNTQLGTGDYFMNLASATGAYDGATTSVGARLGAMTSGGGFRFIIRNQTGGTPTWTDNGQDLVFNTTYLVVVKYDFNSALTVATMWVNPTSLGGNEPAGGVINNGGTNLFNGLKAICIRNGSGTPKAEIDEIRVGTTWEGVTPTN